MKATTYNANTLNNAIMNITLFKIKRRLLMIFVLISALIGITASVQAQVINEGFEESLWVTSTATHANQTLNINTGAINTGSWIYNGGSVNSVSASVIAGTKSFFLAGSTSNFICTPIISGGVLQVTLKVRSATTTAAGLCVGFATNTAVTANTGSISSTAAGAAWSINSSTWANTMPLSSDAFTTITFNVTNALSTNPGYIKIQRFGGGSLEIDDIVISSPSSCSAPTGSPTGSPTFFGTTTTATTWSNLTKAASSDNTIIFCREGSSTALSPVDGTAYAIASTDWNSKGTQVGTSGWYCVYNGSEANPAVTMSNLVPNTAYYFTAISYNACTSSPKYYTAATLVGNTTTLASVTAPTVTTQAVSNITTTTATGNGTITATGGSTSSWESGICWKTSTNPTTTDSKTTNGTFALSSYTGNLTSLTANTEYYVRAYATNNVGASYGNEVNFVTLPLTPTIAAESDVTSTGFTINWIAPTTQGSATHSYTVEIDDDSSFGSVNVTQTGIASSISSYTFTGLSASTKYWCRVKIVNATGSSEYSAEASVTTSGPESLDTDYFRTQTSGEWNIPSNWQSSPDNTTWITATRVPDNNSAEIKITTGHTINVTSNVTADDIIIESGAVIDIAQDQTLTINNGTKSEDLLINGKLKNNGTLSLTTGGIITVNNDAIYEHAVDGSTITFPNFVWNVGSTLILSGEYTKTSTQIPTLPAGEYQHIIFDGDLSNSPAFPNDYYFLIGGSDGVNIHGNLTVRKTGNGIGALLICGSAKRSVIVQDYIQESGNVIIDRNAASGTRSLNVSGNLEINGGTLYIRRYENASQGLLNVRGNITIDAGGIISNNSAEGASAALVFSGENQVFTNDGLIENVGDRPFSIYVNNDCILDMGTSSFGTSSATFENEDNTTIITKSSNPDGLNYVIGVSGNKTLNPTTNYIFNGSSPQTTGAILTNANNITINNPTGLALSANAAIGGVLTLQNGNLTLDGKSLSLVNPVAGIFGVNNHIISNNNGMVGSLVPSGSLYTYPVGFDAVNYNPVTISNTSSGSLTYQVSALPVSPALTNSLKAMWSISGATTASNLSFPWVAGVDNTNIAPIDGGVYQYDGFWKYLGGSTIGFVTNINGITSTNATKYWTIASEPIDFTYHFRSVQSGNWNDPINWELSPDGNTFQPSPYVPTSKAASIKIQANHLITTATAVSGNNLLIEGTLLNNSSLAVTGTFTVGSSGTYEYAVGGNSITFPSIVWNTGSTLVISGYYTGRPVLPAGEYQNIIFKGDISLSPAFPNDYYFLIGGSSGVNIHGDLTANGTGNGTLLICGGNKRDVTVKNYTQESGNVIINRNAESGIRNFIVLEDAIIKAGVLYVRKNGNGSRGQLNVTRNLTVNAGATISNNSTGTASAAIIFNGTNQAFSNNGTIENAGLTVFDIIINSSSILDAGTSSFGASTATFTTQTGATIITAHDNGLDGLASVTGTKNISPETNYEFNSKSYQNSGSLLTATANLTINKGSSGLFLSSGSSIAISGILTLNGGYITLSFPNLVLAHPVEGTPGVNSYIATNIGTSVSYTCATGESINFPIGYPQTGYNPVIITNYSDGPLTYNVSVKAITPALTNSLNAMWSIKGATGSTSLEFPWVSGIDNSGTPPTNGEVYQYNGTIWQSLGGGTESASESYITSVSNITSDDETLYWTVAPPTLPPPTLYDVSGTATICAGTNGTITLSGSQTGISYQLFKDNVAVGIPIIGTGNALIWTVTDAGVYTVRTIATGLSSAVVMTGSAIISMNGGPVITTQPSSIVATQNFMAVLECIAEGENLTYEWYSCSYDGTILSPIPYSNSAALNVQTDEIGTKWYLCKVNSGSCSTTSSIGIVSVQASTKPIVTYYVTKSTSIERPEDIPLELTSRGLEGSLEKIAEDIMNKNEISNNFDVKIFFDVKDNGGFVTTNYVGNGLTLDNINDMNIYFGKMPNDERIQGVKGYIDVFSLHNCRNVNVLIDGLVLYEGGFFFEDYQANYNNFISVRISNCIFNEGLDERFGSDPILGGIYVNLFSAKINISNNIFNSTDDVWSEYGIWIVGGNDNNGRNTGKLTINNNKFFHLGTGILFRDYYSSYPKSFNPLIEITNNTFYDNEYGILLQTYEKTNGNVQLNVSQNTFENCSTGIVPSNFNINNGIHSNIFSNSNIDISSNLGYYQHIDIIETKWINDNKLGYQVSNIGNEFNWLFSTYPSASNTFDIQHGIIVAQKMNKGIVCRKDVIVRDCEIYSSNPIDDRNYPYRTLILDKCKAKINNNIIKVDFSFLTNGDVLKANENSLYGYVVDFYETNSKNHLLRYLGHSPHYSKEQIDATFNIILPNDIQIKAGDRIAATVTHLGDDIIPYRGTSRVQYIDVLASVLPTPEIKCENCIPSFSPTPGEDYMISAWVKETVASSAIQPDKYDNATISIFFNGASEVFGPIKATGAIIDGWQRIDYKFTVPATAIDINIKLNNGASSSAIKTYFDDIRIHPVKSGMKSYVYDPVTLKLSAELDERNYATFYEYDEEGNLVRVKKETERGVKTIQESFTNIRKK